MPANAISQLSTMSSDFLLMQDVLMNMENDAQGRELLSRLKLTGFIAGSPKLYDRVAEMMRSFGER